jgi:hypothetical protein
VPRQGVVVEGVKGVKYAPLLPRMYRNDEKRMVSHTFWLLNCQKRRFSLKSTEQDILLRRFWRNKLIFELFVTLGIVELYLFKVLKVIYAPNCPD